MPIIYPLELPYDISSVAKAPSRIAFRARDRVGVQSSPFTGQQESYQWAAQWLEADIELPPMNRESAESWITFLISLKGRHGSFLLGDPFATSPRGAGGGAPLVAGASQSGSSLVIDGAPVSTSGWLLAGDWIQLSSGASARLHKVLEDVATDGSGAATLELWPDLRESPADNSSITIAGARGRFMLASMTRTWSIEIAQLYGLRLSAIEDQRPL